MQIRLLRKDLYPTGPKYATDGSAALDLVCTKDVEINPLDTVLIGTGLSLYLGSLSTSVAGLILPRSGLGHKYGLVLGNGTGLIDSDYQGEIMVSAHNRKKRIAIQLEKGQRFAQLVIVPIVKPNFNIVEQFTDVSVRNDGGFGSTGI